MRLLMVLLERELLEDDKNMQQMKTRRKAYFIINEFCQNCNLAKLSERIFTIEINEITSNIILIN